MARWSSKARLYRSSMRSSRSREDTCRFLNKNEPAGTRSQRWSRSSDLFLHVCRLYLIPGLEIPLYSTCFVSGNRFAGTTPRRQKLLEQWPQNRLMLPLPLSGAENFFVNSDVWISGRRTTLSPPPQSSRDPLADTPERQLPSQEMRRPPRGRWPIL